MNPRVQVAQVVPFTTNVVGEDSLTVNVPVKPIVTVPDGAIVALYGSAAAAATCSAAYAPREIYFPGEGGGSGPAGRVFPCGPVHPTCMRVSLTAGRPRIRAVTEPGRCPIRRRSPGTGLCAG